MPIARRAFLHLGSPAANDEFRAVAFEDRRVPAHVFGIAFGVGDSDLADDVAFGHEVIFPSFGLTDDKPAPGYVRTP
jgi:hypothetical protein